MTLFLWVAVILMSAALLIQLMALVGLGLTARRAARRAKTMTEEVSHRVAASKQLLDATKQSLVPQVQMLVANSNEMKTLLTSRVATMQAARLDASRRASRIRLRLGDSVQTVGEQQQERRGSYHEVVASVKGARKVLRGISLAIWLLRKVA